MAASVQREIMLRSMLMRKKAGSPGSVHIAGKSRPKTGVRTYRISQQKVAATAFAASNGTQYPGGISEKLIQKDDEELTLSANGAASNAVAYLAKTRVCIHHLGRHCLEPSM